MKNNLSLLSTTNQPGARAEIPGDLVEEVPLLITARAVRDVAIPYTTNVTNSIHRLLVGGRFELNQDMM